MPVRFGATIVQMVPFPLLADDFMFAESIGLDNAWVIDQFGIDGVPEVPLLEARTTAGASGVVVSNHGGRQLDGVEATARVLGGVVDAVGNAAEVYVDSGIRSGSDALRALALGARATLLGRPALYGLVTAGAEGVYDILEAVRDELEVAMGLCGVRNIAEIDRTLISA